jgi:hypothetical protein
VLSDVDSEHENDIEDSSNPDASDPESNEVSVSYSEISASESDFEEEKDGDSRKILGIDGYVDVITFYNSPVRAPLGRET